MGRRDRYLQEDLRRLTISRGHVLRGHISRAHVSPGQSLGLCFALLLCLGCSINPPLKLAHLGGADRTVELSAVPFHPQEAHHCGPASLLTVLQASGIETDYETVAARVYVPGLEGSLQAEMTASARQFGRVAYSLPPEPEALLAEVTAGKPVLVLLNLGVPSRPFWHYAVVVGYEVAANRIIMRSGAENRLATKASVWLRQWDWAGRWAMVLLRPDEWPVRPERRRLLQALADFEDAAAPSAVRRAWQNAVGHWPTETNAWLGLGNAAHALEDRRAADAAYRRVLELAPTHLPARLNLASSLDEEGRSCEGLAEIGAPPSAEHPLYSTFRELEQSLGDACSRSNKKP